MKLDLKPFQEKAALEIIAELDDARDRAVKGKPQAVVLSAPTGSGKTITIAQVIELTYGGGDGIAARPNTTFLWLSDSPELNAQSRNKLLNVCDHLSYHKMVTVESESFDEDYLQPGYVYFINTQLLGRDKLLTKEPGDRRNFTFWQTIASTVARAPGDFILIIDEAHRGATVSDRTRTPIMQKFILGSEPDGLPAVPLILGMSATPQRFNALLGTTSRTQRPINIPPEDVRSSGLLKDLLIVRNPKDNVASDLTLLESAAKTWRQFTTLWESYCIREKETEVVRPILVVQVEDGSEAILTKTPLSEVIRVIERQSGPLGINEVVHCFQEQSDLSVDGRIIRKIEASRIQDTSEVKVVLFKTALTTGWDCPRAEVMMSFRRAKEPTSIAQLVGRMIRTPLARRIESDEVLNTVELFLPHYDSEALKGVLAKLKNPDAEEGNATPVEMDVVSYTRAPQFAKVFDFLEKLPNYTVKRVPKLSPVRRVLQLVAMLVHEGIAQEADEAVRKTLTDKLKALRDEAAEMDPDWGKLVREGGEIELDITQVAIGQMSISGRNTARLTLSSENIDHLFDAAGRVLGAGTGLHRTYWRRFHDQGEPDKTKLELFQLLREAGTLSELEKLAQHEFTTLWARYQADIKQQPAAVRTRFNLLVQASGDAAVAPWELPDRIVEKAEGPDWEKHLYVDSAGKFYADLNGWEDELLDDAMKQPDFVAWLRNMPRREWALCIPYDLSGQKAFFPDFVLVRKQGKGYVADILEPHDDSRTDTWAKAKGLAVFADRHGMDFGRLIIARKKGQAWEYADLNEQSARERARKMQSSSDLESLFA